MSCFVTSRFFFLGCLPLTAEYVYFINNLHLVLKLKCWILFLNYVPKKKKTFLPNHSKFLAFVRFCFQLKKLNARDRFKKKKSFLFVNLWPIFVKLKTYEMWRTGQRRDCGRFFHGLRSMFLTPKSSIHHSNYFNHHNDNRIGC